MTRKKRENLVSAGVALGSLVFLLWVIPTFTPPYPGYGVSSALLPHVAFGSILALSLLSLGLNFFSHFKSKPTKSKAGQSGDIPLAERVYLWRLVCFMIPCILLMPAMNWIGFIPAGLVFMLLIQYLCGQRRPVTMAIVAAVTVGFMCAVMRYGLGIPMP
ncbi:MAG: tripartite tricarboxylate transporter TctB family protein [Desulfobacterales bacterium]|nr:tripartite tricarboxylate transporter TctB family protein [Desulfobacterales bacterium]